MAAEYVASITDGEKQALMLQAMRFGATILTDLEALHKDASQGLQDALAILNAPESEQPAEALDEQAQ